MILVCGECLVDIVEVGDEGGSPILKALPGGGPANTAIALARLGRPVALATRVGSDRLGSLVRSNLVANGVSDDYVVEVAEPTTLALVSLAENGNASYAFYFEATACWTWQIEELPEDTSGIEALHLGSMALAAPSGRRALSELVRRVGGDAAVSLDPNVRRAIVPELGSYRRALESLVAVSDVVRVSEDDLEALYPGDQVARSAARWAALGPRLVVVSRGGRPPLVGFDGAFGDGPLRAATPVVDTVGAGDTYSAALLDAFSRAGVLRPRLAGLGEALLDEALTFATTAASITCERTGADPPSAADVAARLRADAAARGAGRAAE